MDLQKEALSAQGFSLRFENRLPGESPVVLDRIQFQRVLDNVLSNALKYRDSDNGSLTVRLAAKDGGYFIECEDRGRGVAQEDLGRIFESFYRTDKARADVAKGNGLGLAVTARIIEAMKVLNEVTAEADGEVLEICVADGDLVEFGSCLMRIG